MKVGVLACQGAFEEHLRSLKKIGAEATEVRNASELDGLSGLIIPGGESTTISQMMAVDGLMETVSSLAKQGLPIFGTCAGMILLSPSNGYANLSTMKLMDISVKRNAFGRQVESFETELNVPVLGEAPFPAIFIRAPRIDKVGPEVKVLATLPDGTAVAVRQDNLLAIAFHPELTADTRFHRYFIEMVEAYAKS